VAILYDVEQCSVSVDIFKTLSAFVHVTTSTAVKANVAATEQCRADLIKVANICVCNYKG